MPHSLWPPLPCSRQAGRKNQYLGIIAGYSAKDFWCQHRNWAPRGGETQGVPRGTGKTSAGSARVQTLVYLGHHFCSLLIDPQDQHTQTHAEEGIGRVQSLGFLCEASVSASLSNSPRLFWDK